MIPQVAVTAVKATLSTLTRWWVQSVVAEVSETN